jgi:hypothetical protein
MNKKIDLGQFNTKKDVWLKPQVLDFIESSDCERVIDPFAGRGDLLNVAKGLGFHNTIGLDIDSSLDWDNNDSLIDIPYYENTLVITNPPYFSKVSAKTKRSNIFDKYLKDKPYTDIYQIAIGNVLDRYRASVFIIPETYLLTSFFKDNLIALTILEDNPFEDTDCPVCVACFNQKEMFGSTGDNFDIYKNDEFVFTNWDLQNILKKYNNTHSLRIKFNDVQGNIGLRGVDGVKNDDRIRFCLPEELNYDFNNIKNSSRAITILNVSVDGNLKLNKENLIGKANKCLDRFRSETKDVVLAPFKNNNNQGKRRRRLDFGWARQILNTTFLEDSL